MKARHFQQFEFLKLIRAIQNISEVSKEMRLAEKCLEKFLMPFFWADCGKKKMGEINAESPARFRAQ